MGGVVILLLVGLGMAGFGFWYIGRGNRRYADATTRWMRGEATILASEAPYVRAGKGGGWNPRVSYRYVANGSERQGSRPYLVMRNYLSSKRAAEGWLAQNPAGATVPVWYDPDRPEDATIELNKPSLMMGYGLGVTGALAILLALFMLTMMARGS
jgi:hypothetical protein